MRDVSVGILRDDAAQFDVARVDVRTRREVAERLDTEVTRVFVGCFFGAGEDAELLAQEVRFETECGDFVVVGYAFRGDVCTDGGDAGSGCVAVHGHGLMVSQEPTKRVRARARG